ncbi:hypothetical protein MLD38_012758 [Melastoma candidum]|uniref:Uncharacterized protein n=1 Tax=Melastoma candidum TaxID=119954 RepID=A0ACB9R8L9_9MYRT|nr:hypothetical protein MLD38_012758 [Melastoma candidum]
MVKCLEPCSNRKSKFNGEASNAGRISMSHPCKCLMFCFHRPGSRDHESRCPPVASAGKISDPDACEQEDNIVAGQDEGGKDSLWVEIQEESRADVAGEPMLAGYYRESILSHDSLEKALGNHLSIKLSDSNLPQHTLRDIFDAVLSGDPEIVKSTRSDLRAVRERDPACISYVHCLLNSKGFLACQAHRIAHKLWSQGRHVIALLIQNRASEVFAVDIHPGARMGQGLLLDHATGLVVGETAMVGNNVSILHNVTLGGTGKSSGDRHPKIGNGVLVEAGTYILGNIRIGDGAKIRAGSVVLKDVPPRATAMGNPAKIKETPSVSMD